MAGSPCSGHGACAFDANATQAVVDDAAVEIEDTEEASDADDASQDIVDATLNSTMDVPTRRLLAETFALQDESEAATCSCDLGFGGAGCEKVCLRDGNGEICSGHGTCNTDGECVCEVGYVGPSCGGVCPG